MEQQKNNGVAAGAAPIDPVAEARRQRNANMACGLSIRPATGALRMQTPFGLNPLPNYWEIVSGDYPASGFSISGYIHDDDARILTAAKDLLEALNIIKAMPGPVIDGPSGAAKFLAYDAVVEIIDGALAKTVA